MTPYELTQQMLRSLDYCWPTSERSLYDQPERLVAAGFAEVIADSAADGPKRYRATPEGITEVRRWLGRNTAMPKFQNEPLLRVLFADQGSVDDLHRVLADVRHHVAERRRLGIQQLQSYLDNNGLFPERAHIVAIVGDLIARLLDTIDDWAADVEALTSGWSTTSNLGLTDDIRTVLTRVVTAQATRGSVGARHDDADSYSMNQSTEPSRT